MQEQRGRRSPGLPVMRRCQGRCGQYVPETGLGSDGRCLDCRLAPIQTYVPPLSATQRRKRAGLPGWGGRRSGDDYDE
jgi:hypothetical protein